MANLSSFLAVARTERFIKFSSSRVALGEFCIYLQDVHSLMLGKFQKTVDCSIFSNEYVEDKRFHLCRFPVGFGILKPLISSCSPLSMDVGNIKLILKNA